MDETSHDHDHHAGYFDLPEEEQARRSADVAAAGARKARAPRRATPAIGTEDVPAVGDGPDFQAEADEAERRRKLMIGAGVAVVLLAIVAAFALGGSDDEGDVATDATTTTAAAGGDEAVAGSTSAPEATAAPASGAPDVTIQLAAGRAVLTGTVVSEDIRGLVVGGASIAFRAAGEVEDQLTVDPSAPEINAYSDPLLQCLAEPAFQGVGAQDVRLDYDDAGNLRVSGTVTSAAAKDRLVGAAAGRAGGLDRVTDALKVVEPATTTTVAGDPEAPPTTKAPEVVQQDLDVLLSGKVVEFDTGSAALNQQWAATVDEVATILKGGSAKVQIAGHTDNVGDPAANLVLSTQRAETIKGALVARGVAADRITTTGYGQERPVADNGSAEGRQRNRRIEFVVAAR